MSLLTHCIHPLLEQRVMTVALVWGGNSVDLEDNSVDEKAGDDASDAGDDEALVVVWDELDNPERVLPEVT